MPGQEAICQFVPYFARKGPPAPITVLALLLLCLSLHAFVYTTSHCGLCPDEGYILQSVSRAHSGLGLTSVMQGDNIQDISRLNYAYLAKWPPGTSWMLLALVTIGFDIALAYKTLYLALLICGSVVWLLLARKVIGRPEWMVFGLALVTGGMGFSGGKLSDIAMWGLFGAYLGLLFQEYESQNISRPIWSWRTGAVLGIIGFFWYGGIFFAIGGAVTAAMLSTGAFRNRLANSMKCALPGILVFLFIYTLNSSMAGEVPADYRDTSYTLEYLSSENLLGHLPFTLEHFSFANFMDLGGILTANLFGAKGLLMRLEMHSGLQTLLRIIEPIATGICLIGAISCITLTRKRDREGVFVAVVSLHVVVLLGFLIFLSARQPKGLAWTYFTEVRYWTPLISALGVALVAGLGTWWREERKKRRALPLLWAISLMLAFGTAFGAARSVKTGIAACCLRSSEERPPSVRQYIASRVESDHLEPFVIFDNIPTAYIWDGKMEAAPWLDPEALRKTKNSGRVFVFVVLEENPFSLLKSANAIAQRRQHGRVMIDTLELQHMATVRYGTQIYGDWVGPYERGSIMLAEQ
ncbi:MAG: hypothetical protein SWE60_05750 [Thermodesulfobacteriota bacterium]|nr:hypothetical protein [Thermodesulfobacteriota bacterium]